MKKIYFLLAEGFELIETTTPIDIFKRTGIKVVTLSLGKTLEVNSAQDIKIIADDFLEDYKDANGIFLAGGYSFYENLPKSDEAFRLIKYYLKNQKLVIAISGAPYTLAKKNLIIGKTVSVHQSFLKETQKFCDISNSPITIDDNLITCKGTGYSQELAFEIIKILVPDRLEKVKKGLGL